MEANINKKRDLILIAALILSGLVILLIVLFTGKDGKLVTVDVDGVRKATYSLDVDATYVISGVNGGTNTIVIEGGKVHMSHASCPDHLCINMGSINNSAQSIICLPNKVVIGIAGGEAEADIVIQ